MTILFPCQGCVCVCGYVWMSVRVYQCAYEVEETSWILDFQSMHGLSWMGRLGLEIGQECMFTSWSEPAIQDLWYLCYLIDSTVIFRGGNRICHFLRKWSFFSWCHMIAMIFFWCPNESYHQQLALDSSIWSLNELTFLVSCLIIWNKHLKINFLIKIKRIDDDDYGYEDNLSTEPYRNGKIYLLVCCCTTS